MNESQEQLYQDLRKWADSRGNWNFVRDLEIYYTFLNQREIEIINQEPVRPLQGQLHEVKAKT